MKKNKIRVIKIYIEPSILLLVSIMLILNVLSMLCIMTFVDYGSDSPMLTSLLRLVTLSLSLSVLLGIGIMFLAVKNIQATDNKSLMTIS